MPPPPQEYNDGIDCELAAASYGHIHGDHMNVQKVINNAMEGNPIVDHKFSSSISFFAVGKVLVF